MLYIIIALKRMKPKEVETFNAKWKEFEKERELKRKMELQESDVGCWILGCQRRLLLRKTQERRPNLNEMI